MSVSYLHILVKKMGIRSLSNINFPTIQIPTTSFLEAEIPTHLVPYRSTFFQNEFPTLTISDRIKFRPSRIPTLLFSTKINILQFYSISHKRYFPYITTRKNTNTEWLVILTTNPLNFFNDNVIVKHNINSGEDFLIGKIWGKNENIIFQSNPLQHVPWFSSR